MLHIFITLHFICDPMSKPLVIVESPTKARTIEKFLGKGYEVLASYGHIRDLPNNAAEIPANVKKEKWARLGVNIEANFEPLYVIPGSKQKRVKELKAALKGCSEVLLATDEDREGESISWHLLEVLRPKVPVKRLVFHEITKEAIKGALESARSIDDNLVKAQEARRIIDRLFGYLISPILWKKLAPKLSAGRVQSVALRLLVERERERIDFKPAVYWDLKALFAKASGDEFEAELAKWQGKRVASSKDFDPKTGKLTKGAELVLLDQTSAERLKAELSQSSATVLAVEERPFSNKPYPPFTTSTLQQEGSRKFRFSARRTMTIAQTLYENGYITYMRTDSTNLSEEALQGSRRLIEREFGSEYLSDQPRLYKTKVKNAQEAHEAIRPAGLDFAHPDQVRSKLGAEAARLYEMIWKRTLASQMKDCQGIRVAVQIGCGEALFKASGKTIRFPGYLRAYVEGSDDPEAEIADQEKILPALSVDDVLGVKKVESLSHQTQPPPRYTEGSLIKELEKRGIGRPSTWATIVDIVLSRTYAFKKGTALVPTFLASAVIGLMEKSFTSLVNYEFTARMEDDLDAIARGERESLSYLKTFYFGNGLPGLQKLVADGEEKIDPREVCGIPIGKDKTGRQVEVRVGRYGLFLTNGETRAALPDGVAPDELRIEEAGQLIARAERGPESLGNHPDSGKAIYVKTGRYGPYIQLGEQGEGEEKPKMVSLLPGMSPETVSFEDAVRLLELPKVLGADPDSGNEITVALGPYGPYVKAGTESRSLTSDLSPLDVTLAQAVELLRQPKSARRRAQPQIMREVGVHPVSELPLTIRTGRYGPYVTDGKINASIPRGSDPQSITIDDAVNLLEARAAKLAAVDPDEEKPKTKRKGKAAKSSTTKTTAKKAAPKKAPQKGRKTK